MTARATTTAPQQLGQQLAYVMKPTNPLLPGPPDFDKLKVHRNINLINEKKCGSSVVTDRIIGGEA
jgi:hypothetical protein